MGKKAKFKKIRRLANQLPEINTKIIVGETLTGSQVVYDGVSEIDGKPVNHAAFYKKKRIVEKPLNHNRKMKKMYNKYGAAGVNHYANAVIQYAKQKQDA